MGSRQSYDNAIARTTFEEFYNGGVVQASLPQEEWRGLHKFCLEHHIPKSQLLKLFRTYVPVAGFVGVAEVKLASTKAGFLNTRHQQEITDLFIPLVIHQDNAYLPSSHTVTDTAYLSRFIVQSFIISTESTHDLLHDFFSGVFGKRHIRFTNTTFLANFCKLLSELCEDMMEYPTVRYILHTLGNGFKGMHQVSIVTMVRCMLRYPAVSYAVLHWRNGFRRKLFGEKLFDMRDPLPSKSFRSFGYENHDHRQLPLRNPNRNPEKLYFSGPHIPSEEGGLRRKQSTHIRRSFLRQSTDFLRTFSSSIQPEAMNANVSDLHEWGFQTPEQAVRYTARVLLYDIVHNHKESCTPLPSALSFLDQPTKLLSILTDRDCSVLKRQLGYKLLRGLIEDGGIAVSFNQAALQSQPLRAQAGTVSGGRKIPIVPPSHRELGCVHSHEEDQELVKSPNDETKPEAHFDVSSADLWVTDERLQRQFLYNPVTGERRWVVPIFDNHWEPVAAMLD